MNDGIDIYPVNNMFGAELLMNMDKKNGGGSSNMSPRTDSGLDIEFDDLNNLEKELNNLSDDISIHSSSNLNFSNNLFDDNASISSNVKFNDEPTLGKTTSTKFKEDKTTWDGYQKINNIPLNPDKPINTGCQMTKEELLTQKMTILRELEKMEKKGIELTKKYTIDSSYTEMKTEFDILNEDRTKRSAIKFQKNLMMSFVNGIEWLSSQSKDIIDINLDGFSDSVMENSDDYDDIFGALHEKYKGSISVSPELSLLWQLGSSAVMVHMTNKMFKSSIPGVDDLLRQNPELMRSFQTAAIQSMSEKTPGFSGFVSGMMNHADKKGPPAPIRSQEINQDYMNRGGNNSFGQFKQNMQPPTQDNIRVQEYQNSRQQDNEFQKSKRPMSNNMPQQFTKTPIPSRNEMKGPSDISDVLSKLKTKTISIPPISQQQQMNRQYNPDAFTDDNMSTISFSEINEPKKRGRKKGSSSNRNIPTMSLDI